MPATAPYGLDDEPRILKLFADDATEPPERTSAGWTLQDCYDELVRPELHGRKPDTVAEYELHLRRWGEFLRSPPTGGKPRIMYPGVISSIDKPAILAFRSWLQSQQNSSGNPLFSARTINKHVGTVLAILRSAADEGRISRVPSIKPLDYCKAADKVYLESDEVSALYDACVVARWPRKLWLPAVEFWRALIVIYFNYGLRTEEAVKYESRHRSLTGANVCWSERSPERGSRGENKWGWLTYLPEKQERKKPVPLTLPLNEVTHAHLRAIEPPGGWRPDQLVFPFPLTKRSFYATFEAIRARAGIRPPVGASEDEFQLKHLRKTCTTLHNRHAKWPVAQFITGHAEERGDMSQIALSKVSADHYDNNELSVQSHILGFPQPEAFLSIFSRHRPRQLELF